MLAGFKKFILQGNVVDLAVGVVIGAAFGAVISAFTGAFIEPLIKLIGGGGVDGGTFTVGDPGDEVIFNYGAFINAAITFAMTAAVIYFVIVLPMNTLKERRNRGQEGDVEPSNEEKMLLLLQQIAEK